MSKWREIAAAVGPGRWPLVWQGVGALLIGIGLGALVFPLVANVYTKWQQRDLREEFESWGPVTTDTAPATEAATPATPPAAGSGFPLSNLVIPSIGLNVMVTEWTGPGDLRRGPVHDYRTALPGADGNCVITGHRNVFGSPFLHLDQLKQGDEILLKTPARAYWFLVDEFGVCKPDAIASVVKRPGEALTLVTCHPVSRPTARYYVRARPSQMPSRERSQMAAEELLRRVPLFTGQAPPGPPVPEEASEEAMDPLAVLAAQEAAAAKAAAAPPPAPEAPPPAPEFTPPPPPRPAASTPRVATPLAQPPRPAAASPGRAPATARTERAAPPPARRAAEPTATGTGTAGTATPPAGTLQPGLKLALPLKRAPQGTGEEESQPAEGEGNP